MSGLVWLTRTTDNGTRIEKLLCCDECGDHLKDEAAMDFHVRLHATRSEVGIDPEWYGRTSPTQQKEGE